MTLVVGTVTGLIAVFVTFCTKALSNLKLTPVYTALHVAGGRCFCLSRPACIYSLLLYGGGRVVLVQKVFCGFLVSLSRGLFFLVAALNSGVS